MLGGLGAGLAFAAAVRVVPALPRALDGVMALILVAAIAFTIAHAGAEDRYFGDQGTTFWEWGGINRSLTPVAVVIAVVALLGLAVSRRMGPNRPWPRVAALAAAGLASGMLLVGVFALSIGH